MNIVHLYTLNKLSTEFNNNYNYNYNYNYYNNKKTAVKLLPLLLLLLLLSAPYFVFNKNLINTTIPCQTLCKIGWLAGKSITRAIRKIQSFLMTLKME
jgi:hypothetical protein